MAISNYFLSTSSRIDGNGFSDAEFIRNRSRSGSHDPRHLSGEVIRQMSVLNKKGNASAAAAAASMAYQQQLQMQETYARVLKVSYSDPNVNSPFNFETPYRVPNIKRSFNIAKIPIKSKFEFRLKLLDHLSLVFDF